MIAVSARREARRVELQGNAIRWSV